MKTAPCRAALWILAVCGLVLSAAAPVLARPKESARVRLERTMKEIILPEVTFRQANVRDVIEYLSEMSVRLDPDHRGVNMVLNLAAKKDEGKAQDEQPQLVTFTARQISLFDTLNIVTQVADLKYRYQGNVVMIVPTSAPDGAVVVRTYDVTPDFKTRIKQVSQDMEGLQQVK